MHLETAMVQCVMFVKKNITRMHYVTCKENGYNKNKRTKRHSKQCKYFIKKQNCKFGSDRAYSHIENSQKAEHDIIIQEMNTLKEEVKYTKTTVETLTALNDMKYLKIEIIQIQKK